jgi:hypothetical protein
MGMRKKDERIKSAGIIFIQPGKGRAIEDRIPNYEISQELHVFSA